MRCALSLYALTAVALLLAAPVLAGPALVTCPKLATAPTIDGSLDPGEWSQAAAVGPFALLRAKGMPSLATQAWIGYTDEGVYVAARLFDPAPLEIRCYATARDGAVAADDSFHLLLDTDASGKSVIHLAVNAAGTTYDALNDDPSADFKWQAATGLTGDSWIVELVARFEAHAARAGDTWRMTMYRNAPRVSEKSAWSALERGVLEPANFGELVFGGPGVRCEVAPMVNPWFGENTVAVTLENRTGAAVDCKINARVTGTDRRAHSFTVTKVTLPAGARKQEKAAFTVQRGGPGAVEVSVQVVTGEQATTVLRTVPMPFELPALGQALDDALGAIAAAYRAWAVIPAGSRPEGAESQLEALLARWRYLESQHQQRQSLGREQLQALVERARALQEDAEELAARFSAG